MHILFPQYNTSYGRSHICDFAIELQETLSEAIRPYKSQRNGSISIKRTNITSAMLRFSRPTREIKIIGSYSLRIVSKLNALQLVSSLLCRPRAEDRERKKGKDRPVYDIGFSLSWK